MDNKPYKIIGIIMEKTMRQMKNQSGEFASFTVNDMVTNTPQKMLGCFFPDEYNKVEFGDFAELSCVLKKDGKYVNVNKINKLYDKTEAEVTVEEWKAVGGEPTPPSQVDKRDDYQLGQKLGHAENQALTVLMDENHSLNRKAAGLLPEDTWDEMYAKLTKHFFELNENLRKDIENNIPKT